MEFDDPSHRVIGCAIEFHHALGPGLLDSAYEQCLAHEMRCVGIRFELKHPQSVEYKGLKLDCGYRIDLHVEGEWILELKRVDQTQRGDQAFHPLLRVVFVLFASFVVLPFYWLPDAV